MRNAIMLSSLVVLAACNADSGANSSAPAAPVAAAPAPAGQSWVETVSETAAGGFVMGNPNAAVKLIEYGSRGCPACGAFARDAYAPLTAMVETGKVSFEFRDFLVQGAADLGAAVLGRCGGPGPFFPLMEQMYANQAAAFERLQAIPQAQIQQLQSLPPQQQVGAIAEAAGYIDFVKQRGISETQARACLADEALIQKVVGMTEGNPDVTGTPTFLINGETVPNAVSWPQVEAALKAAGA